MDAFQQLVWQKGEELYRSMPWRDDTRPYYVLVSELMLQQTQVARVIPKFEAFIRRFPNEKALAAASLAEVLQLWQGLGYNRRAKYLHDSAKMIVNTLNGVWPTTERELRTLPGVGVNTAGALRAYSFNQPSVFIETNVRTVYFHHFFPDITAPVTDNQLRDLVAATVSPDRPRQWYWALMDYGTELKAQGVRNISQSHHYKKQSPLKGSVREMRGRIVAALGTRGALSETALFAAVDGDDRFAPARDGLLRDGLITQHHETLHLTK